MNKLTLFLLLLVGLTFASCSDDEATPTTPETPFITATVDGTAFAAASITAIGDEDTFDELLVFTNGTNAAGDISIGLNIPGSVTIDETYAIDANDFGILYGTADEEASYITVGNVTITEFDTTAKSMRGSFDFTATNFDDETEVFTVTGGEFFVEYE